MNAPEELLVKASNTIREAMQRIDRYGRGIVFVVDEENRLVSTITDGDIRRAILADLGLDAKLEDVMQTGFKAHTTVPVTASEDTSLDEQMQIMEQAGVRHLPLVDKERRVVDVTLFSPAGPPEDDDDLPIQAVIMAGGFGTRLRPFTDNMPKPMLPIGGRPLMERTIERLHQAGINRINITTHYLPEKITGYFGNGRKFGVDLNYVAEDQPLGTAGALGLVGEVEEPLLVMNGDILTRVDFKELLRFHHSNSADLTVGVRQYEFQVPYGVIESDAGIVKKLSEKPNYHFLVNAGIYLLEPSVRRLIPHGVRYDMTDLIERLLQEGGTVASFPVVEYWADIGQHDDLKRAQDELREMRWAS